MKNSYTKGGVKMLGAYKLWTEKEIEILKNNHNPNKIADYKRLMSLLPGRPQRSIKDKLHAMGRLRNRQAEIKQLRAWCLEKVQKLPYKVTTRWVFYRALQEFPNILENGKDSYKNFKNWFDWVRRYSREGWKPDTLIDDTRGIEVGSVYEPQTPNDWISEFVENIKIVLDKNVPVIVLFEAAAMKSQFEYYCEDYHVPFAAFKGDPSIHHKWTISQFIKFMRYKYNKKIMVLYFGDADKRGKEIPKIAFKDFKRWGADFEVVYCGLTKHQAKNVYKLPEDPDNLGQYQWEALEDKDAATIITSALDEYVDKDAIGAIKTQEGSFQDQFVKHLKKFKYKPE